MTPRPPAQGPAGAGPGGQQRRRPEPGLFLADKAVGETSFAVVQRFQAALAGRPGRRLKVCHGGALDPFAEGLLPVLVGQATKLFDFLHDAPKTYEATLRFGVETDTGDHLGRALEAPRAAPGDAQRDEALAAFSGWLDQVPPATSNKRVDGERAYVRAHRGEAVTLPPSRVYLHQARFTAHREAESDVELVCRGGFYVRSLARDVGQALGCGAHLTALRRTAIGPWRRPPPGQSVHVTGEGLLPWLPSVRLDDAQWGAVRRGAAVPGAERRAPGFHFPDGFPAPAEVVRAFHQQRLVALLTPAARGLAPKVVLPGGL